MVKSKKTSSIRLFENPHLEKWTHVHPLTPLVLWGPVIGFLIWRGFAVHGLGLGSLAITAISALLFWTFCEYVMHRWVFHFKPRGKFQERIMFLIHGVHHSDPQDATRLVMPPVAAIVLAAPFYVVFRLVLGPVWGEPFFGFFLIGYLIYDYTHYAVHHFRPRTFIGRYLKDNHMKHHFVNPESRWGVSNTLWDFVFGTIDAKVKYAASRNKTH